MSRPPRGLTAGEAALWRRLAETVTPLNPPRAVLGEGDPAKRGGGAVAERDLPSDLPTAPRPAPPPPPLHGGGPPPRGKLGEDFRDRTLDGSWERKLAQARLAPDLTIDLHGLTIDQAYARLGSALNQAVGSGARLVLVIAGKERPHEEHGRADHSGRGKRRGAIRAKLLDWLAAGSHASRIAAVRPAHQRHGGAGAVYVVLRRAD